MLTKKRRLQRSRSKPKLFSADQYEYEVLNKTPRKTHQNGRKRSPINDDTGSPVWNGLDFHSSLSPSLRKKAKSNPIDTISLESSNSAINTSVKSLLDAFDETSEEEDVDDDDSDYHEAEEMIPIQQENTHANSHCDRIKSSSNESNQIVPVGEDSSSNGELKSDEEIFAVQDQELQDCLLIKVKIMDLILNQTKFTSCQSLEHRSKYKTYCNSCGICRWCTPRHQCGNNSFHTKVVACFVEDHSIPNRTYCGKCGLCSICFPRRIIGNDNACHVKKIRKCFKKSHTLSEKSYCFSCGGCRWCKPVDICLEKDFHEELTFCKVDEHKDTTGRTCGVCYGCIFCPPRKFCSDKLLHRKITTCYKPYHRLRKQMKYCTSCAKCKYCSPSEVCEKFEFHVNNVNYDSMKYCLNDENLTSIKEGHKLRCYSKEHRLERIFRRKQFCFSCKGCPYCPPLDVCGEHWRHSQVKPNHLYGKLYLRKRKFRAMIETLKVEDGESFKLIKTPQMIIDDVSTKIQCAQVINAVFEKLCPGDPDLLQKVFLKSKKNNRCCHNLASIALCGLKDSSNFAQAVLAVSIENEKFTTMIKNRAMESLNIDRDTALKIEKKTFKAPTNIENDKYIERCVRYKKIFKKVAKLSEKKQHTFEELFDLIINYKE